MNSGTLEPGLLSAPSFPVVSSCLQRGKHIPVFVTKRLVKLWLTFFPARCLYLHTLLLSRFSRVRLCATP